VAATVCFASFSLYLFSGTLPVYLYRNQGYSLQAVGFLVGVAFIVQLFSTLLVGPLVDRRGARLALRVGPALYLAAALLFLVTAKPAGVGAARVLQGVGIGLILPAAFALTPTLVPERWRGTALGALGVFMNLALAVGPPAGLFLLSRGSTLLFLVAAATSALGFGLSLFLRVGSPPPSRDRLFTYRSSWTPLLAVTFLTVVYWGVVTAFLPIHVPQDQVANVGWFFAADAIGVLLFRIPAGFFSDRFGPRWLLIGGVFLTVGATSLLLLPPGFLSLVVAGFGTGAGAALLLPPILLELTKRSDDSNRGTAMALYGTSFAAAIGVGSLAAAPLVERVGFHGGLLASILCCLAAIPIILKNIRTDANL
jgi:MFS family permease